MASIVILLPAINPDQIFAVILSTVIFLANILPKPNNVPSAPEPTVKFPEIIASWRTTKLPIVTLASDNAAYTLVLVKYKLLDTSITFAVVNLGSTTANMFAEGVSVPAVEVAEILPFASMVILLPAINADTTLEFVKYKLPAVSITFAVYNLFQILDVTLSATTVLEVTTKDVTLPVNTPSVTLIFLIIKPLAYN